MQIKPDIEKECGEREQLTERSEVAGGGVEKKLKIKKNCNSTR